MKRGRIRSFDDEAVGGVNIVPVIDLCLVLLVILMILSPIIDKPPVDAVLPKARTVEEKEKNIAVTVTPDGRIAVNADLVLKKDLSRYLGLLIREQGDNPLVVVRADENVQYKDLTEILKMAKEAGARNISLGTEPLLEGTP